jgi:hypothetical protein
VQWAERPIGHDCRFRGEGLIQSVFRIDVNECIYFGIYLFDLGEVGLDEFDG